jgi:clan AA aspartic protease (TIGR02281 family)
MKRIFSLLLLAVCATIVCAKEPKQPNSYNYQRGVEAISDGNYDEGEDYLQLELKENPKNGYAYAWLSSVETERDELGNAIAMLHKALQYLPKNDKYYIAWSYSSLAGIHMQLNDTLAAINYLTKAIKTEPTNSEWLERRGYFYMLSKQYDLALEDFQKAMDKKPGIVSSYILTAEVYYRQEKYQEALDLYKYANSLAERAYIYAYMAATENKLHNYEQAADYIINAFHLEQFQDDAIDLFDIKNQQLLDELLPRIQVQVTKNPNAIEWKYYLLAIYNEKKQYEDAIQVAQAIKKLDSDPYFDGIISDIYQDFGDFEMALQYALAACESDTTDTDYQYDLISVYTELNRLDDALQIANMMVNQNPDKVGSYATRADIYFNMQDYAKAIEDYNTAIALQSSNNYLRFKRGYSYLLSNDTTKAHKDFQRNLQDAKGNIEEVFAMIHLGMTEPARAKADSILLVDTLYHSERYNIACCYALLGETELAFSTLEQELLDGYTHFNHIRRDIDFISLRGERLDSLLTKYENLVKARTQAFRQELCDQDGEERVVEIPFTKSGGVTKVDCTINNLPLNFIFDTGASDVTISQVEANFMYKNGYLDSRDIVGKKTYQVATGAIAVGTTIILKQIEFGGLVLHDVRASVVETQNAPLLLGQTVLQRLGKIEIDNTQRLLKITTNQ